MVGLCIIVYSCIRKYVEYLEVQWAISYVGRSTGSLKNGARASNSVPDVLFSISVSCVLFNLYCFQLVDC